MRTQAVEPLDCAATLPPTRLHEHLNLKDGAVSRNDGELVSATKIQEPSQSVRKES